MRYLILLMLAALCLPAFSQKAPKPFKKTDGPEYEARRSTVSDVIGSSEHGTVIIRTQKKNQFLELVNAKGSVTTSVPLATLKYNKLKKVLVGGMFLGDRLFLRFSAYDKAKKIAYGMVDEYDPKSLALVGNVATESTDMKGAKTVFWYGIGLSRALDELGENGYDVSPARNFVVDYTSSFTKDKEAPEMVMMRVYDSSFSAVWEKEFEIPYSNALFKITKVVVDDAGNTHLIGREYESSGDQKRGTSAFKYHVLSFRNNGEEVKDNVIELTGKFITDLTIGITQQQELMAAGFYSNKGFGSIDGTFAMKVDVSTGNVLQSKMKEFDAEFLRLGMTEKEEKKADKKEEKGKDLEMEDYDLDEIWFTADGGCILVAEQFYITERTYTTSGPNGTMQTRTIPVFNHDDIIAVKVSSQCDIEWNQKIVKHQSWSYGTGPMSYLSAGCTGDIVFLYNKRGRHTNEVIATIIRANGEMEEHVLMDNEKDELMMYPQFSSSLEDCQMLLYSARKKVYQFSFVEVLP